MTVLLVNLAATGVATLSSEEGSNLTIGTPELAIDGLDSSDLEETCISVLLQDDPWWQLDLAGIYLVTSVSVVAQSGSTQELNGAEIRVGLRDSTSNPRSYQQAQSPIYSALTFSLLGSYLLSFFRQVCCHLYSRGPVHIHI